jgi:hypothetical protein
LATLTAMAPHAPTPRVSSVFAAAKVELLIAVVVSVK